MFVFFTESALTDDFEKNIWFQNMCKKVGWAVEKASAFCCFFHEIFRHKTKQLLCTTGGVQNVQTFTTFVSFGSVFAGSVFYIPFPTHYPIDFGIDGFKILYALSSPKDIVNESVVPLWLLNDLGHVQYSVVHCDVR